MKPLDIFIAYISWGEGGKNRPVLVFVMDSDTVDVYRITTKYNDKSEAIKAQYFKINDWAQAGLNTPSYVDTGTLITLTIAIFKNKAPLGALSTEDKLRLLEFLL